MAEQRAQRRLAAILAVDVVGYSRLMEADEAGTLRRLKALRADFFHPKVAEYGGRIVKTTGDGTLVEFPSAVDAVQHALDVQMEMARRNTDVPEANRIALRMGINLGDIIIEGEDIYGDGVNVAARLEALAEPGGICLSGTVYEHVCNKIDAEFEDIGEQRVKNITRPVRVYRVEAAMRPKQTLVEGETLALPDKPSIAVLPFANLSGDQEQEYFADGMVEDIITSLSRLRWLFVIARNSSFTYKARNVDVRQVGRELGIRYVLEGSIRKGGNRLRISAQLVEAATGNHLWAEKFDCGLTDIFAVQDEITQQVVAAIEPSLRSAEIARAKSKPTENLDAYDLYLRSLPESYTFTEQGFSRAEMLLREAVDRDPNYAEAWAMLADCIARQINGGWVKNAEEAVVQNRQAALRAVQADPENGLVLSIAAFSLGLYSGQLDRAMELCEQALSLQPNSAAVLTNCGWVLISNDEADRALIYLNTARRLNPRDPRGFITLTAVAAAHFFEGRFAESERQLRRSLEIRSETPTTLRYLAACLVQFDRMDEAKSIVSEILRRTPSGQSRRIRHRNPEKRKLIVNALKKAGLPDP